MLSRFVYFITFCTYIAPGHIFHSCYFTSTCLLSWDPTVFRCTTLPFDCLSSHIIAPHFSWLLLPSLTQLRHQSVRSIALAPCHLVSDIFLTSFNFSFKVWLAECSLRFLSYHFLFSSSFPVLSRFIFSNPLVFLHSCHRFMFVRHFLFHLVYFTVLSYFTVPLHRRWFHYHFLPRFIPCSTSVFQDIFCCFAPFCISSIRMYSCYLLYFKDMYLFVFSSTSRIRSCILYIHYFFNRYIQLHFFHFLHLALYDISSCYIQPILSSLFVAYIVLTRFFRPFPHFNFFLLYDIMFLCFVLFRSSFSVYLVFLSPLPVSFCLALLVFAFPVCILYIAPHRLNWPWTWLLPVGPAGLLETLGHVPSLSLITAQVCYSCHSSWPEVAVVVGGR